MARDKLHIEMAVDNLIYNTIELIHAVVALQEFPADPGLRTNYDRVMKEYKHSWRTLLVVIEPL